MRFQCGNYKAGKTIYSILYIMLIECHQNTRSKNRTAPGAIVIFIRKIQNRTAPDGLYFAQWRLGR